MARNGGKHYRTILLVKLQKYFWDLSVNIIPQVLKRFSAISVNVSLQKIP